MHRYLTSAAFVAGLFAAGASFAQAPAGAPAGSTGLCKDGSYTTHATKKGACAGHKGVKEWFTAAAAAPAAKPAATTTSTQAMPAPSATTTSTAKPASKTAAMAPAAGGGPGQVWVNTATKVYHCPGTRYYGKTKQGEYMSEAAAKAAGDHADHGKACS